MLLMPFAAAIARIVTPARRLIRNKLSPGWTTYVLPRAIGEPLTFVGTAATVVPVVVVTVVVVVVTIGTSTLGVIPQRPGWKTKS
jgi:hypothetical protein